MSDCAVNLEKFLIDQNKTVEFVDMMANIPNMCHVNHSGSFTLKEIHLLVATLCAILLLLFHCMIFRDMLASILMEV